jgi:hypothetical protein
VYIQCTNKVKDVIKQCVHTCTNTVKDVIKQCVHTMYQQSKSKTNNEENIDISWWIIAYVCVCLKYHKEI